MDESRSESVKFASQRTRKRRRTTATSVSSETASVGVQAVSTRTPAEVAVDTAVLHKKNGFRRSASTEFFPEKHKTPGRDIACEHAAVVAFNATMKSKKQHQFEIVAVGTNNGSC